MYSFDVFDTLITRSTALPQGIFALMGAELREKREINKFPDFIIDNFYELRIHSEQLARHSASFKQVEEVTLRDIYRAMAVSGYLNEDDIESLCRMEEGTELQNVVGIDASIKTLKELVERGERVVLISDMYLPGKVIRRMLCRVDEVFTSLPLYVSSDYGVRKTTGSLYRRVQEAEKMDYRDWTHYGDNLHQDMEIPHSLGIRVRYLPRKELTPLEERVLNKYGADHRLQRMIGTACQADTKGSDLAKHIGCRYAGPVLYSYAEWIVRRAEEKGIKRLYFIARDGYLIKKIVDCILSRRNMAVKTYYIFGSRKAWRMPSLSEKHYNLYQIIWWSHCKRIRTLDELAAVMHVPLDGLYSYLPGVYLLDKEHREISSQELEYIVRTLSSDKDFMRYHLCVLQEERRLVQRYLAQEVDVSDDSFAFVDVSGGGLTQGCLSELLQETYAKPIRTYFFKIDMVRLTDNSIPEVFMPGFLENNLIIEMMCRAPHGQTEGYKEAGGRIIPVMEETEGELLVSHGFKEYEEGILEFSENMCRTALNDGLTGGSFMKNVLSYMEIIATEPPEEVLDFFASMPSSESGRGYTEYAPRLTQKEIEDIFLLRTYEPIEYYYKGTNLNYSILRASEKEKEYIEKCRKEYDSIRGKLYRQDKEWSQVQLRRKYGRAAFYPVRLLERRIVLYGAGKFGQDLYERLIEDENHEVVLWADKNAVACRERGMTNVHSVQEIEKVSYDQIVIAVMDSLTAGEIQRELEELGIEKDKILWIEAFQRSDIQARWRADKL